MDDNQIGIIIYSFIIGYLLTFGAFFLFKVMKPKNPKPKKKKKTRSQVWATVTREGMSDSHLPAWDILPKPTR